MLRPNPIEARPFAFRSHDTRRTGRVITGGSWIQKTRWRLRALGLPARPESPRATRRSSRALPPRSWAIARLEIGLIVGWVAVPWRNSDGSRQSGLSQSTRNPVFNRICTGRWYGKFERMLAARVGADEWQNNGANLVHLYPLMVPTKFGGRDKAVSPVAALSRGLILAGRIDRKPDRVWPGLRLGEIPGSNR